MNAEMKDQIAELMRGTSEVLVEAELVKKLSRCKPLRIKAGFELWADVVKRTGMKVE